MLTLEKNPRLNEPPSLAWLDLLRESLWCKTYLHAALRLCLQYVRDFAPNAECNETERESLLAFLTRWEEAYGRESPTPPDLEILFNLDPGKNPEQFAARSASLQAWLAPAQRRLAVLIDLSLRTFQNSAARARTAAALAQASACAPPENTAAFRHELHAVGLLEILLGETRLSSPPRWLILDQNNVCNFKCKMCLTHAEGMKNVPSYFMPSENLRAGVALADKITLGGSGEPLMYPDLARLLQDQGPACYSTINTNASLAEKHLESLRGITEIDISFDGDNPATFEALRCGGSFEKTLSAIGLLRQKYPEKIMILNIVVSRLNADEVAGIAKIADRLGLAYISVTPVYIVDPRLDFLRLRQSDQVVLAKQYGRIAAECAGRVTVINNILPEIFLPDEKEVSAPKSELRRRLQAIPPGSACHNLLDWKSILAEFSSGRNFAWWPGHEPEPPVPRQTGPLPLRTASTLRARAQELGNRLGKLEKIRLPFCLAPWLIGYVTAHAMLKPCCYYTYPLDETLVEKPLEEIWNSLEYRYLREAMLGQRALPVFCRHCQANMRTWGKDRLLLFAADYGFKYRAEDDALEFDVQFDLATLLPRATGV